MREQTGDLAATVTMLVELLRETLPEHTEHIHHGAPWFYVRGRPVAYVAAYSEHANLGFRYGAELEDPDGLLEGTGKSMRHVKVHGPRAIPRTQLVRLIEQAARRT